MNHQMVILMFTKVTVLFLSIVVIIAHMVQYIDSYRGIYIGIYIITWSPPEFPGQSPVPLQSPCCPKRWHTKGLQSDQASRTAHPPGDIPGHPSHSIDWWNLAANCDAVSCNWNQLDTGKNGKNGEKRASSDSSGHQVWCSVDAVLTVIWLLLICWCAWICLWLNVALGFVPASWDSWGPCKQSHSWTVGRRRVCKDLSSLWTRQQFVPSNHQDHSLQCKMPLRVKQDSCRFSPFIHYLRRTCVHTLCIIVCICDCGATSLKVWNDLRLFSVSSLREGVESSSFPK